MHTPLLVSLLSLVLSSACASPSDPPFAKPGGGGSSGGSGGGGGGGGGMSADASTAPDAASQVIHGQLCLIEDLRKGSNCAAGSVLSGILVEEVTSGETATSDSDGRFSLPLPSDRIVARLKVGFTDTSYHNLLVPVAVGIDPISIPLIAETTWHSLLTVVGVQDPSNLSAILAYVATGGAPISGAQVAQPSGGDAPIYDRPAGPNDWQSGGRTGQDGAAILLSVPAQDPEVRFEVSVGPSVEIISGVPVMPGTLTIVTAVIP